MKANHFLNATKSTNLTTRSICTKLSKQISQMEKVYNKRKISDLMNSLLCYEMCKRKVVVDNSLYLYSKSRQLLGGALTDAVVKQTFGKVFTGGDNWETFEQNLKKINKMELQVIGCYSVEAKEGSEFNNQDMDACVFEYLNYIEQHDKYMTEDGIQKRSKMAVKFTALLSKHMLSMLNHKQVYLLNMFGQITTDLQGRVTVGTLKKHIESIQNDSDVMTDFDQFIKQVFKRETVSLEQEITQLQWKIYMKTFYLDQQIDNNNKVIRLLGNYTDEEMNQLQEFSGRIQKIVKRGREMNVQIFIDAEQTFYQKAIDDITMQLQVLYNYNEQNVVFNTFQNYLKETQSRIIFEIEKNRYLGIQSAIKMVRGAYVIEESQLAESQQIESPLCNGYDATSASYHASLEHIITTMTDKCELLVASHNQQTCSLAVDLMEQIAMPNHQVCFGFLQGLSDEITFSLYQKGYTVYKYVPYGPTNIMIPYLCRRAEESFQMMSNLDIQISYIKSAIKSKIFTKKDSQTKNN